MPDRFVDPGWERYSPSDGQPFVTGWNCCKARPVSCLAPPFGIKNTLCRKTLMQKRIFMLDPKTIHLAKISIESSLECNLCHPLVRIRPGEIIRRHYPCDKINVKQRSIADWVRQRISTSYTPQPACRRPK